MSEQKVYPEILLRDREVRQKLHDIVRGRTWWARMIRAAAFPATFVIVLLTTAWFERPQSETVLVALLIATILQSAAHEHRFNALVKVLERSGHLSED